MKVTSRTTKAELIAHIQALEARQSLESVCSNPNDALKAEVEALRAERDTLVAERDTFRSGYVELRNEYVTLTQERDALGRESDALQRKLEGITLERDGLLTERSALRREREALRAERDEAHRIGAALVAESRKFREKVAAERATAAPSQDFVTLRENAKKLFIDFSAKAEEVRVLKSKLAALRQVTSGANRRKWQDLVTVCDEIQRLTS